MCALQSLRREYLSSLRGPQEAWLEEQLHIRNPDFFTLRDNSQVIGYCCVDQSKSLLLQFFVREEFSQSSIELFETILRERQVRHAYVTTRDPLALSLCLTYQKDIALESYLFEHRFPTDIKLKDIGSSRFRLAVDSDLEQIREASGDFYGDVESAIKKSILYVLTGKTGLLGVGYLSTEFCSPGAANLGMFTSMRFRGRGIGSYVLQRLVGECRSRGLLPIAACYHENLESKRALEKAGFVSYDRTLLVSF
jgi:GNAT superfamily N-acetyltransferase